MSDDDGTTAGWQGATRVLGKQVSTHNRRGAGCGGGGVRGACEKSACVRTDGCMCEGGAGSASRGCVQVWWMRHWRVSGRRPMPWSLALMSPARWCWGPCCRRAATINYWYCQTRAVLCHASGGAGIAGVAMARVATWCQRPRRPSVCRVQVTNSAAAVGAVGAVGAA